MPRKPNPKKMLESIIESHLKHLEYYKSIGMKKSNPRFYPEYAETGRYVAEFSIYKDYSKLGSYTGRMADLLK